jgi:glycosyltransferase involved in cell wall biosynthesis
MGLLNLPDRYWGWYLPALREATRLIREERIAALLSSGPPWTAHLIARRLRKKYRLPWLADFRDPWTQSRTPEQLPSWWKRLRQRLEASCIRWADLVVCNTDALRQNFAERYPGMPNTKWVTLTNGFDDSIADPPPKESNSSTRLLLHLGDIYGIRRTDTFFQAIADLAKAGKLDPTCTKIVFFGGADLPARVAARQWAGELVQSSCIEFRPRVSWRQAQEALWKADLLLLFQGGYRRTVPAKFYEYLQTGKPIFAVAEEGALTDLVGETESGIWADPGDPTNIAKKLLLALGLSARPPAEIQQRWAGKYHYRSLSGRLAEWVYKLAGAGAVGQPSPS